MNTMKLLFTGRAHGAGARGAQERRMPDGAAGSLPARCKSRGSPLQRANCLPSLSLVGPRSRGSHAEPGGARLAARSVSVHRRETGGRVAHLLRGDAG